MDEKAVELQKYADLEGTELGEMCTILCSLFGYPDYMSEEFFTAIENEITKQLDNFKTNSKIVEIEETVVRKVVDLEWYGVN